MNDLIVGKFAEASTNSTEDLELVCRIVLSDKRRRVVVIGNADAARKCAALLGYRFVPTDELLRFTADGQLDTRQTDSRCRHMAAQKIGIVVPGLPDGDTRLSGSDAVAATIAAGMPATVFEKWTNQQGVLFVDPAIVPETRAVSSLSYAEMRELAYAGARGLHEDAIVPLSAAGVPTNIRSVLRPELEGTWIWNHLPSGGHSKGVVGITGRNGFYSMRIEKPYMHEQVGYVHSVLSVLKRHNISLEHMPSSIDSITLVFKTDAETVVKVEDDVFRTCSPSWITNLPATSLIMVVGEGMHNKPGMLAAVAGALARGGINIRMVDQDSSERNIIIGVYDKDMDAAIRALYDTCH
jgi:aspartate kinase